MRVGHIVALLAAIPLMPAGAAPGRTTEHLVGKCESDGNTHLFRVMGYPAFRGMDCAAIDIDWNRQIVLTDEQGRAFMTLRAHRGSGYELIVDQVDEGLGQAEPAEGRCEMFANGDDGDEPAAPRLIECFVSVRRGSDRMAMPFRFTVTEPLPSAGTAVQASGACGRAEAMDVVLLMELERDAQKELPPLHSPPFACDQAVTAAGASVTFSQGDRPDTRLRFSGRPGGEQTRLVIDSVAFGDRPPRPVLTGTCLSIRMPDGQLQTSCGAAYREGTETRVISTEFTPQKAP